MKYVSLDLETTSLIPDKRHILMVSMVVEDTDLEIPVEELPHFTCFLKWHEIQGQAYALAMNSWILDYVSGRVKNPPYAVLDGFMWESNGYEFLRQHFAKSDKITVAGKNVGTFDLNFLPFMIREQFRHRVLDPGSLFFDPKIDSEVPNFAECKRRAGITTPVAHDAREDAMDVIRLLRISL